MFSSFFDFVFLALGFAADGIQTAKGFAEKQFSL
jgi:hypothetical protein